MFTSDTEIIAIGTGLRDRTLPKPDWTHAAHIAAAVWMLDQYGDEAFACMPDVIRAYNVSTNVANTDHGGYHHTITIASLIAIRACCGKGSLFERTNRILNAGYANTGWLLEHYTKETLFSVQARRNWVAPDLRPLPSL